MTTKSPTSTWGAYWGLCLPRSRIALWVRRRPSTTAVASMTCQVRAISPGLGVYVRTALVSSVVVGKAGGFASPSTGDVATHGHQPACARQSATIPGAGQAIPARRRRGRPHRDRALRQCRGAAWSGRTAGPRGVPARGPSDDLAEQAGLDVVD